MKFSTKHQIQSEKCHEWKIFSWLNNHILDGFLHLDKWPWIESVKRMVIFWGVNVYEHHLLFSFPLGNGIA